MFLDQVRAFIDYNQYNFPELALVVLGYLAIMWLGIVLWVWRDITTRSRNPLAAVLSVLLVLFGNILGLFLYLLLRPAHTLEEDESYQMFHHSVIDEHILSCSKCQNLVRDNYQNCPACGAAAHLECPQCHKRINPIWHYCVHCGADIRPEALRARLLKRLRSGAANLRERLGLVPKLRALQSNMKTLLGKIVSVSTISSNTKEDA